MAGFPQEHWLSTREIEQKRSNVHLKEHSSYRSTRLSLEVLRRQRTFVLGISFAVVSSQSTEQVSHQTELIFNFVKYYIKSCSQMYTLCTFASLHSPALHPLQSCHSSAQGRLYTSRTTYTRTSQIRPYSYQMKLPPTSDIFLLFRNLDLKSHSIMCQGYASPIYCSHSLPSLLAAPPKLSCLLSWTQREQFDQGQAFLKIPFRVPTHWGISSTIHWRTAPEDRVAAQK